LRPALIDIHTHVDWGATYLSVDANTVSRAGAVATLVDAGSSGAANFNGFGRFIVEQAQPRVLAFLNISQPGLFCYGINMMVEEASDCRLLSAKAAYEVGNRNRDIIVGLKVRLGALLFQCCWTCLVRTSSSRKSTTARTFAGTRRVVGRTIEIGSASIS